MESDFTNQLGHQKEDSTIDSSGAREGIGRIGEYTYELFNVDKYVDRREETLTIGRDSLHTGGNRFRRQTDPIFQGEVWSYHSSGIPRSEPIVQQHPDGDREHSRNDCQTFLTSCEDVGNKTGKIIAAHGNQGDDEGTEKDIAEDLSSTEDSYKSNTFDRAVSAQNYNVWRESDVYAREPEHIQRYVNSVAVHPSSTPRAGHTSRAGHKVQTVVSDGENRLHDFTEKEEVGSDHVKIVRKLERSLSIDEDGRKSQVSSRLLHRRRTIEVDKNDMSGEEVRHTSYLNFSVGSELAQSQPSVISEINIVWGKTIDTDEVSYSRTSERSFRSELQFNPSLNRSVDDSTDYWSADMSSDTVVTSDYSMYASDSNDSFLEYSDVHLDVLDSYNPGTVSTDDSPISDTSLHPSTSVSGHVFTNNPGLNQRHSVVSQVILDRRKIFDIQPNDTFNQELSVVGLNDNSASHQLDRTKLYKVRDSIANLGRGTDKVEQNQGLIQGDAKSLPLLTDSHKVPEPLLRDSNKVPESHSYFSTISSEEGASDIESCGRDAVNGKGEHWLEDNGSSHWSSQEDMLDIKCDITTDLIVGDIAGIFPLELREGNNVRINDVTENVATNKSDDKKITSDIDAVKQNIMRPSGEDRTFIQQENIPGLNISEKNVLHGLNLETVVNSVLPEKFSEYKADLIESDASCDVESPKKMNVFIASSQPELNDTGCVNIFSSNDETVFGSGIEFGIMDRKTATQDGVAMSDGEATCSSCQTPSSPDCIMTSTDTIDTSATLKPNVNDVEELHGDNSSDNDITKNKDSQNLNQNTTSKGTTEGNVFTDNDFITYNSASMIFVDRSEEFLESSGTSLVIQRVNSRPVYVSRSNHSSTDVQAIAETRAQEVPVVKDAALEDAAAVVSAEVDNEGFILVTSRKKKRDKKTKNQKLNDMNAFAGSDDNARSDIHREGDLGHTESSDIKLFQTSSNSVFILSSSEQDRPTVSSSTLPTRALEMENDTCKHVTTVTICGQAEQVDTCEHETQTTTVEGDIVNQKENAEEVMVVSVKTVNTTDNFNTELTSHEATELLEQTDESTRPLLSSSEPKERLLINEIYDRDDALFGQQESKTPKERGSAEEEFITRILEGTDIGYSLEKADDYFHADESGEVLLNMYTGGHRRILKPCRRFTKSPYETESKSDEDEIASPFLHNTEEISEKTGSLEDDTGNISTDLAYAELDNTEKVKTRGKGYKRKREGASKQAAILPDSGSSELNVSEESSSIDISFDDLDEIGNVFDTFMMSAEGEGENGEMLADSSLDEVNKTDVGTDSLVDDTPDVKTEICHVVENDEVQVSVKGYSDENKSDKNSDVKSEFDITSGSNKATCSTGTHQVAEEGGQGYSSKVLLNPPANQESETEEPGKYSGRNYQEIKHSDGLVNRTENKVVTVNISRLGDHTGGFTSREIQASGELERRYAVQDIIDDENTIKETGDMNRELPTSGTMQVGDIHTSKQEDGIILEPSTGGAMQFDDVSVQDFTRARENICDRSEYFIDVGAAAKLTVTHLSGMAKERLPNHIHEEVNTTVGVPDISLTKVACLQDLSFKDTADNIFDSGISLANNLSLFTNDSAVVVDEGVTARELSEVVVTEDRRFTARGRSDVVAEGDDKIDATDLSQVVIEEDDKIDATDLSDVVTEGDEKIDATDLSEVVTEGDEKITTSELSEVVEKGDDRITPIEMSEVVGKGDDRITPIEMSEVVEEGDDGITPVEMSEVMEEGDDRITPVEMSEVVEVGDDRITPVEMSEVVEVGDDRITPVEMSEVVEEGDDRITPVEMSEVVEEGDDRITPVEISEVVEEDDDRITPVEMSEVVEEGDDRITPVEVSEVVEVGDDRITPVEMSEVVEEGDDRITPVEMSEVVEEGDDRITPVEMSEVVEEGDDRITPVEMSEIVEEGDDRMTPVERSEFAEEGGDRITISEMSDVVEEGDYRITTSQLSDVVKVRDDMIATSDLSDVVEEGGDRITDYELSEVVEEGGDVITISELSEVVEEGGDRITISELSEVVEEGGVGITISELSEVVEEGGDGITISELSEVVEEGGDGITISELSEVVEEGGDRITISELSEVVEEGGDGITISELSEVVEEGGDVITISELSDVVQEGGDGITISELSDVVQEGGDGITISELSEVVEEGGDVITISELSEVVEEGGDRITISELSEVVEEGGDRITISELSEVEEGGDGITISELSEVVEEGGDRITISELSEVVEEGGDRITISELSKVVEEGGDGITISELSEVVEEGGDGITISELSEVVEEGGDGITISELSGVVEEGGDVITISELSEVLEEGGDGITISELSEVVEEGGDVITISELSGVVEEGGDVITISELSGVVEEGGDVITISELSEVVEEGGDRITISELSEVEEGGDGITISELSEVVEEGGDGITISELSEVEEGGDGITFSELPGVVEEGGDGITFSELPGVVEEGGDGITFSELSEVVEEGGDGITISALSGVVEEGGDGITISELSEVLEEGGDGITISELSEVLEEVGDGITISELSEVVEEVGDGITISELSEVLEEGGDGITISELSGVLEEGGDWITISELSEVVEEGGDGITISELSEVVEEGGDGITISELSEVVEEGGDRITISELSEVVEEGGDGITISELSEVVEEGGDRITISELSEVVEEGGDGITISELSEVVEEGGDRITISELSEVVEEGGDGITISELSEVVEEGGDRITIRNPSESVEEENDWITANEVLEKVEERDEVPQLINAFISREVEQHDSDGDNNIKAVLDITTDMDEIVNNREHEEREIYYMNKRPITGNDDMVSRRQDDIIDVIERKVEETENVKSDTNEEMKHEKQDNILEIKVENAIIQTEALTNNNNWTVDDFDDVKWESDDEGKQDDAENRNIQQRDNTTPDRTDINVDNIAWKKGNDGSDNGDNERNSCELSKTKQNENRVTDIDKEVEIEWKVDDVGDVRWESGDEDEEIKDVEEDTKLGVKVEGAFIQKDTTADNIEWSVDDIGDVRWESDDEYEAAQCQNADRNKVKRDGSANENMKNSNKVNVKWTIKHLDNVKWESDEEDGKRNGSLVDSSKGNEIESIEYNRENVKGDDTQWTVEDLDNVKWESDEEDGKRNDSQADNKQFRENESTEDHRENLKAADVQWAVENVGDVKWKNDEEDEKPNDSLVDNRQGNETESIENNRENVKDDVTQWTVEELDNVKWESDEEDEKQNDSQLDKEQLRVEKSTEDYGDIVRVHDTQWIVKDLDNVKWESDEEDEKRNDSQVDNESNDNGCTEGNRENLKADDVQWTGQDVGDVKWKSAEEDEKQNDNLVENSKGNTIESIENNRENVKVDDTQWTVEDLDNVKWESDEEDGNKNDSLADNKQFRENESTEGNRENLKAADVQWAVETVGDVKWESDEEDEKPNDSLVDNRQGNETESIEDNRENVKVDVTQWTVEELDNVKWESDEEDEKQNDSQLDKEQLRVEKSTEDYGDIVRVHDTQWIVKDLDNVKWESDEEDEKRNDSQVNNESNDNGCTEGNRENLKADDVQWTVEDVGDVKSESNIEDEKREGIQIVNKQDSENEIIEDARKNLETDYLDDIQRKSPEERKKDQINKRCETAEVKAVITQEGGENDDLHWTVDDIGDVRWHSADEDEKSNGEEDNMKTVRDVSEFVSSETRAQNIEVEQESIGNLRWTIEIEEGIGCLLEKNLEIKVGDDVGKKEVLKTDDVEWKIKNIGDVKSETDNTDEKNTDTIDTRPVIGHEDQTKDMSWRSDVTVEIDRRESLIQPEAKDYQVRRNHAVSLPTIGMIHRGPVNSCKAEQPETASVTPSDGTNYRDLPCLDSTAETPDIKESDKDKYKEPNRESTKICVSASKGASVLLTDVQPTMSQPGAKKKKKKKKSKKKNIEAQVLEQTVKVIEPLSSSSEHAVGDVMGVVSVTEKLSTQQVHGESETAGSLRESTEFPPDFNMNSDDQPTNTDVIVEVEDKSTTDKLVKFPEIPSTFGRAHDLKIQHNADDVESKEIKTGEDDNLKDIDMSLNEDNMVTNIDQTSRTDNTEFGENDSLGQLVNTDISEQEGGLLDSDKPDWSSHGEKNMFESSGDKEIHEDIPSDNESAYKLTSTDRYELREESKTANTVVTNSRSLDDVTFSVDRSMDYQTEEWPSVFVDRREQCLLHSPLPTFNRRLYEDVVCTRAKAEQLVAQNPEASRGQTIHDATSEESVLTPAGRLMSEMVLLEASAREQWESLHYAAFQHDSYENEIQNLSLAIDEAQQKLKESPVTASTVRALRQQIDERNNLTEQIKNYHLKVSEINEKSRQLRLDIAQLSPSVFRKHYHPESAYWDYFAAIAQHKRGTSPLPVFGNLFYESLPRYDLPSSGDQDTSPASAMDANLGLQPWTPFEHRTNAAGATSISLELPRLIPPPRTDSIPRPTWSGYILSTSTSSSDQSRGMSTSQSLESPRTMAKVFETSASSPKSMDSAHASSQQFEDVFFSTATAEAGPEISGFHSATSKNTISWDNGLDSDANGRSSNISQFHPDSSSSIGSIAEKLKVILDNAPKQAPTGGSPTEIIRMQDFFNQEGSNNLASVTPPTTGENVLLNQSLKASSNLESDYRSSDSNLASRENPNFGPVPVTSTYLAAECDIDHGSRDGRSSQEVGDQIASTGRTLKDSDQTEMNISLDELQEQDDTQKKENHHIAIETYQKQIEDIKYWLEEKKTHQMPINLEDSAKLQEQLKENQDIQNQVKHWLQQVSDLVVQCEHLYMNENSSSSEKLCNDLAELQRDLEHFELDTIDKQGQLEEVIKAVTLNTSEEGHSNKHVITPSSNKALAFSPDQELAEDIRKHRQLVSQIADQGRHLVPVSSDVMASDKEIRESWERLSLDLKRRKDNLETILRTTKPEELRKISLQAPAKYANSAKPLEELRSAVAILSDTRLSPEANLTFQQQYQSVLQKISSCLDVTEQQLFTLPLNLEDQIEQNKNLREQIRSLQGEVTTMNEQADDLIKSTNSANRDIIGKCLSSVNERVKMMEDTSQSQAQDLQQTERQWKQYHNEVAKLKRNLENIQKLVLAPTSTRTLDQLLSDNKKIEAQLKKCEASLEELKKKESTLTQDYPRGVLTSELATLQSKCIELQRKAVNKKSTVQNLVTVQDQYQKMLQDIAAFLETAQDKLQAEPISANYLSHLKRQLTAHNDFFSDLEVHKTRLDSLASHCNQSTRTQLQQQHSALSSQILVLVDQASLHGQRLDRLTRQWTDLEEKLTTLQKVLSSLQSQMPQSVVSGDSLITIQEKLSKYKWLHLQLADKRDAVFEVVDKGKQLLHSINCSTLETAINGLANKWVTLNADLTCELKKTESLGDQLSIFETEVVLFSSWLIAAKMKLASFKLLPTSTLQNIRAVRAEVEKVLEFRKEVENQRPLKNRVIAIGNQLLQNKNYDTRDLASRLRTFEEEWTQLETGIVETQEYLHQVQMQLMPSRQTLNELTTWTEEMSRSLEKDASSSARTVTDIKVMVKKYKDYRVELVSKKMLLDFVNQQVLVPHSGEVNVSNEKLEFAEKLEDLNKRWEKVITEVNDRLDALEGVHSKWEEYEKASERLQAWFHEQEDKIKQYKMIGSEFGGKQTLNDCTALQQQLQTKLTELASIKALGNDLIIISHDSPKNQQLINESLSNLDQNWKKLEEQARQLQDFLSNILDQWAQYHNSLAELNRVLAQTEYSLNNHTQIRGDIATLRSHVLKLKNLHDDLRKNFDHLQSFLVLANQLRQVCDPSAQIEIQKTVSDIQTRWRQLTNDVTARCSEFEHYLSEWQQFESQYSKIQGWLDTKETLCTDLTNLDLDSLEKCKQLQQELDSFETQATELYRVSNKLMTNMNPSTVSIMISRQTAIEQKMLALKQILSSFTATLSNNLSMLEKFNEVFEAVKKFLTDTEDILACEDPTKAAEMEALQSKLHLFKELLLLFSTNFDELDTVNDLGYRLALKEIDATRLRELNHKWHRLYEDIKDRSRTIQEYLLQQQDFTSKCETWMTFLTQTEQNLAGEMKGNLGDLSDQLRKCEQFENEMYSRQQVLDVIISDGQKMMMAGEVEDRDDFQRKLHQLSEQWQSVARRASQKKAVIEEMISQWQEFNTLSQQLKEWLKDNQDVLTAFDLNSNSLHVIRNLVEKIQSINHEFKLQEPTFKRIHDLGNILLQHADDSAAKKIKGILSDIQLNWHKMQTALEDSKSQLENVDHQWLECEGEIDDMMNKLKDIRNILNSNIPTTYDALQNDMSRCKDIENDFDRTEIKQQQLLDKEKQLSRVVEKEDMNLLHQRLQLLNKQRKELQYQTHNREERITSALVRWTNIDERLQSLLDWIEDMTIKVISDGDIHVEDLLAKLDNEYKPELEGREFQKITIMKEGSQLMKVSSDSRALDIEQKLCHLENKWQELKKVMNSRGRKLRETVFSIKQLDINMKNLSQWLSRVENKLSEGISFKGSSHREIQAKLQDSQELQQDIEHHSADVFSVLDLCEMLLLDKDACPTENECTKLQHAKKNLERRWQNICTVSPQRKTRIEETWQLLETFRDDCERFSKWMTQAEKDVRFSEVEVSSVKATKASITKYEDLQRNIHDHLSDLEHINRQYCQLAKDGCTDTDGPWKTMMTEINDRWDALHLRVTEIMKKLRHSSSIREDFEVTHISLMTWLTEVDMQLSNLQHPTSLDLQKKVTEIRRIEDEVYTKRYRMKYLEQAGVYLMQKGDSQEALKVQGKLDEFRAFCRTVLGRVNSTKLQIEHLVVEAEDIPSRYSNEDRHYLLAANHTRKLQNEVDKQAAKLERYLEESPSESPPLVYRPNASNGRGSLSPSRIKPLRSRSPTQKSVTITRTVSPQRKPSPIRKSPSQINIDITDGQGQPRHDIASLERSAKIRVLMEQLAESLDDCNIKLDRLEKILGSFEDTDKYMQSLLECEIAVDDVQRLDRLLKTETSLTSIETVDTQMKFILRRWEHFQRQAKECDLRISQERHNLSKFASDIESMLTWLNEAEALQSEHRYLPSDSAQLDTVVREYQDFLTQMECKKPTVLSINQQSKTCLRTKSVRTRQLREKLHDMNKRWELILSWASGMQRDLQFQEFLHTVDDYQLWLESIETKIRHCEPISLNVDESFLWEKYSQLTEFHAELKHNLPEVLKLKDTADRLLVSMGSSETSTARDKMFIMHKRLQSLIHLTSGYIFSLENRLQAASKRGRAPDSFDVSEGRSSGLGSSYPSRSSTPLQSGTMTQRTRSRSPFGVYRWLLSGIKPLLHFRTKDKENLSTELRSSADGTHHTKSQDRPALLMRVIRAALPIQLLLLLLFLLFCLIPVCEDENSCMLTNNLRHSIVPMLQYTDGAPPI